MKYLKNIYSILQNTNISLWKYCLISFVIILIISTLVNASTNTFAYLLNINNGPQDIKLNLTWKEFILTCLIAPVVETFFVVIISNVFNLFCKNKNYTALFTGLVCGLIHSKTDWVAFFGLFCMFYFYSTCYLTRCKVSFLNGFIASFTPHAFNNFIIFIVLYMANNFN